jgi:hypothetical protein
MTKGGGFTFGARRHHRTDFHLRLIDDDAINESFQQLSALGKRQMVECRVHALTKRLDALGSGSNMHMLLRLGIEVSQWRC